MKTLTHSLQLLEFLQDLVESGVDLRTRTVYVTYSEDVESGTFIAEDEGTEIQIIGAADDV